MKFYPKLSSIAVFLTLGFAVVYNQNRLVSRASQSVSVEEQIEEELVIKIQSQLYNDGLWDKRVRIKECQLFIEKKPLRSCTVSSRVWKVTSTFNLRQITQDKDDNIVENFGNYDGVVLFFSEEIRNTAKNRPETVKKLSSGKHSVDLILDQSPNVLIARDSPSTIIQQCSGNNRLVAMTDVAESLETLPSQGLSVLEKIYQIRDTCGK